MSDRDDIANFDYELPPEAIAQHPANPRDSARLLVAKPDGTVFNDTVRHLADHLRPGDLLVVNDTKVLAARLNLTKETGGAVEVLLLSPTGVGAPWPQWQALVRPGRRVPPGTPLYLGGAHLATVGERMADGRRLVAVAPDAIDEAGAVPLPPYITAELADPARYQTVFARREGSVAAPTAGLHLTESLLAELASAGIEMVAVELMVGLGTFKPITTERVSEHVMHTERYAVSEATWERINSAERVVAVGTTVVRTLESIGAGRPFEGETDLFINSGFRWQVVDVLLTNFHVPRSSLLVMIDAFVGPRWRGLYQEALAEGYRFLSFGDAMLLERRELSE